MALPSVSMINKSSCSLSLNNKQANTEVSEIGLSTKLKITFEFKTSTATHITIHTIIISALCTSQLSTNQIRITDKS